MDKETRNINLQIFCEENVNCESRGESLTATMILNRNGAKKIIPF